MPGGATQVRSVQVDDDPVFVGRIDQFVHAEEGSWGDLDSCFGLYFAPQGLLEALTKSNPPARQNPEPSVFGLVSDAHQDAFALPNDAGAAQAWLRFFWTILHIQPAFQRPQFPPGRIFGSDTCNECRSL